MVLYSYILGIITRRTMVSVTLIFMGALVLKSDNREYYAYKHNSVTFTFYMCIFMKSNTCIDLFFLSINHATLSKDMLKINIDS